jgi:hypothetical protein
MSKKKVIIPEIPQEVKEEFLNEVLLTHDMIQESRADDKIFQGEASLKWQLRSLIEWQRSPCTEHGHSKYAKISHEICSRCRRIAWEALKG